MGVAYNPKIVTNGLVLALDAANSKSYPGTGTAWNDLSGKGNNGTLVNGITYSSNNLGAMTFDGTNDFISGTLTPPAFNSSSTIEVFVRPSSVTGGIRAVFVHGRTGVSFSSGLVILDGQLRFRNSNSDYAFPSPTTLVDNTWYHLVLSTDSNGTTGYCNGVSQGTIPYKITSNSLPEWNIGRRSLDSNIEQFVGNIGILRVYQNKALTEEEVNQNFNASRGRYGI